MLILKLCIFGKDITESLTLWDGKTKRDYLWEMLQAVVSSKRLAFNTVLMSTWYTSEKFMQAIDKLGKIYYFFLKINR
jgi:hypothetical protein